MPEPISSSLTHAEILFWLRETNPARLDELFARADRLRRAAVGDAVHLRGLVEISSHCRRQCMYCGLRAGNSALRRYHMTAEEIRSAARSATRFGYGTIVLQAGEDPALEPSAIAALVAWIKHNTPLAVTLSLGERSCDEFRLWRQAGADRYLLRFETSDAALYRTLHPALTPGEPGRIELLLALKQLGYEAGGGVMVGLPGQSYESLASDLETFRLLDLDMIGIGPYIAHPATPLGSGSLRPPIAPAEQVPATESMVCKTVALARLLCPQANLPATTALATLDRASGRKLALAAGANVVMPNLTPPAYRSLYQIYPGKACVEETAEACNLCLLGQIRSLGRFAGRSSGSRGSLEAPPPLSTSSQPLVELQG